MHTLHTYTHKRSLFSACEILISIRVLFDLLEGKNFKNEKLHDYHKKLGLPILHLKHKMILIPPSAGKEQCTLKSKASSQIQFYELLID